MELKRTKEYQDVFDYMKNILCDEFPTSEFTPEYLMLSILDIGKCHANMMIDTILMSDTMEYLKGYYHQRIATMDRKPIVGNNKGERVDKDLAVIMSRAIDEAKKLKASKVGTEHIILAILNEEYGIGISSELVKCGLTYEYVSQQNTGFEEKDDTKKHDRRRYVNNTSGQGIPLKSEIQSRPVTTNSDTPFIKKYTLNLNEEVSTGEHDNIVGRDDILGNMIRVLSRRKKNNVILCGKPGVGKTSMVYKLAEMICNGDVPETLVDKTVIMLNPIALVSGTHLRGMFEERVEGLFRELRSNPRYILFIDDMQNVLNTTGRDRDCDLTDMIGSILPEGDVRVVATISFKDYRNGIERNPSISTKLQKIVMEPATEEESFRIIDGNRVMYENFHHVKFSDEVVRKAISLAKRYVTNNNLPDSAIDIIDLTGASVSSKNREEVPMRRLKDKLSEFDKEKNDAMTHGDFERLDSISKEESVVCKKINDLQREFNSNESNWYRATEADIEETVSAMTNIPVRRLKAGDRETVMNIASILKRDVVGQDEAISEVAKAIKRAKAGFGDRSKVMATLLCIGSTACGKTLIAKKLAENIYGSEGNLVRFDMSEYQDKTSVNKLIGSSAGYVGYENGGLLTEAIKNKPYCVLLFDEIEKADDSIFNLFLQLFDEGRLTDNNGTTVNFKNVIVIMTSNVGARAASERGGGIGFTTNVEQNKRSIIEKSLKSKFNPEFLNRIDKIIHFNTLTDDNLRVIVGKELDKLCERVKENGITIHYDDKVVGFIHKQAVQQKEYGARPIMRIIQDTVSDKLVNLVLENEKNVEFSLTVGEDGDLSVKVGNP